MRELYLLRAFVLPAASFVLLYAAFTAMVALAWRFLRGGRNSPALLFWLRIAPLALALLSVAMLIVPAYVRFEPMGANEEIGWPLATLAIAAGALLVTGVVRALAAWMRTARMVSDWEAGASRFSENKEVSIYESRAGSPAVVLAGITRPKLLVSRAALEALEEQELRLVLDHERHHATHRDNLRRLLMAFDPAPGLGSLERAWKDACELAADRAAVRNRHEALVLASELLKLSRLAVEEAPLATCFASAGAELLERRVRNLIEWEPEAAAAPSKIYMSLCACAATVLFAAHYGTMLWAIHGVSEWLIR